MTRMAEQKQELLESAIKSLKQLRHLTGNNAVIADAQSVLEGLKVVL